MTKLMEPEIVKKIGFTLRSYKQENEKYNILYLNTLLFILLFGVIGIFLFYKYKGKPTKEEIQKRKQKNYNEIIHFSKKINMYQKEFFKY